jgi:hypothetical protein
MNDKKWVERPNSFLSKFGLDVVWLCRGEKISSRKTLQMKDGQNFGHVRQTKLTIATFSNMLCLRHPTKGWVSFSLLLHCQKRSEPEPLLCIHHIHHHSRLVMYMFSRGGQFFLFLYRTTSEGFHLNVSMEILFSLEITSCSKWKTMVSGVRPKESI